MAHTEQMEWHHQGLLLLLLPRHRGRLLHGTALDVRQAGEQCQLIALFWGRVKKTSLHSMSVEVEIIILKCPS